MPGGCPSQSDTQRSTSATILLETPLIKKINTARGYYIYDTWTNEIVQVDRVVFGILSDGSLNIDRNGEFTEPERKAALEQINSAKQEGLFRQNRPEIETFPADRISEIVDQAMQDGPEQVILCITEQCNLRCRYCIYSGAYHFDRTHSNKSMSLAIAEKALDWYFRHNARTEFHIGFYGGEPLMAFPMIRRIVARARRAKGEAVHFGVTTNGTLLSKEIGRFLIAEKVRILFSLDGPAFVHDRYRVFRNGKGSHSMAWEGIERLRALDEEFFKRNVTFNMVLAPPVELKAINRFIDERPDVFKNIPIMVSRVNTQPSQVHRQLNVENLYKPSPKEIQESSGMYSEVRKALWEQGKPAGFSRFYYERAWVDVHQRTMNVMDPVTPSHGQCIPGKRKCFVDGDGGLYMCERVNPAFKIGDLGSGIDAERVKEFLLTYNRFFKAQCSQCWAIRLCHKCYSDVREGEEWSHLRGREFCAGQRARLQRVLTQYCEIRETRDDAFQWTEDIQVV